MCSEGCQCRACANLPHTQAELQSSLTVPCGSGNSEDEDENDNDVSRDEEENDLDAEVSEIMRNVFGDDESSEES